jgi:ATP-dependent Clp protease ATP-binding subunit ClpB
VDFRNAVIILTSNLGSHHYADPLSDSLDFDVIRERIMDEVRQYFRPEFINRLDDIVVFHQLGSAEIKKIVQIQLTELTRRLAERRIELHLTDAAAAEIATSGFDPVYGARPLKRAIQKEIVNRLAQSILRGEVKEGQQVEVDYREGSFTFSPTGVAV